MEFSIITISAFVAIANEATKKISDDVFKFDIHRYIPIFSIVYGVILGIVGYFGEFEGFGESVVTAIFIGMSSGAAATGCHQIGKQLATNNTSDTPTEEPP